MSILVRRSHARIATIRICSVLIFVVRVFLLLLRIIATTNTTTTDNPASKTNIDTRITWRNQNTTHNNTCTIIKNKYATMTSPHVVTNTSDITCDTRHIAITNTNANHRSDTHTTITTIGTRTRLVIRVRIIMRVRVRVRTSISLAL